MRKGREIHVHEGEAGTALLAVLRAKYRAGEAPRLRRDVPVNAAPAGRLEARGWRRGGTVNEAVRLLEESAARLEVRGWARGTYGPSEGPNCIAGVISWTGHDLGLSSVVYTARKAVTALPGFPGPGLTHWNDFCCTGPAEASDMLRTAAKRLQEEADVPRA